jgi:hypothetical protein
MVKHTLKTNAIYAAVSDALEYYNALLDKRVEYFDTRSEAWHEGDKCDDYSEDNDTIETIVQDLESVKENLESLHE